MSDLKSTGLQSLHPPVLKQQLPPATGTSAQPDAAYHKKVPDYVLDVPYTWSFFTYQSPVLLSYVARLNGFFMPPHAQPFSYCDLGCGNGVSLNFLAAAYPHATFYGVDFNAGHIINAQSMAEEAGLTNIHFINASFEQYELSNPPKFDYIALHGIYSWVGVEIRGQIRSLIDQCLNPGGLVYLSYNTLPGWSTLTPLWKMMQSYITAVEGDSIAKVKIGLENIAALRDAGAGYFRTNPSASRFLDKLLARDPHYVAHEFCNGCFEPQYFRDVAYEMADIGLSFAGNAKIRRNNPDNVTSRKQKPHLEAAPNALERESRASFMRNESFRRDIYIRDRSKAPAADQDHFFDDLYLGANVPVYRMKSELELGYRHVNLASPLYQNLIRIAAGGDHNFAELCHHPELGEFSAGKIMSALHDLIAGEQFQPLIKPVQPQASDGESTYRLVSNTTRAFMARRLILEGKAYVESPVLGTSLRLNFINGLFTLALDGHTLSEARTSVKAKLAQLTDDQVSALNLAAEFRTEAWLDEQFRRFTKRNLPILVKFGILQPDVTNRPD
ncbi:class I SAM-dependent methyltransferase [Candidatus Halocynthiibacter alkanivorans]|uniref:class I SAM-dependent methyltransferase n=1 Tax=Candidatus Halocynthiibacter alkanivorans TaxID=2267619 RepID=UPI000DF4AAC1|nr:class I SAM-dependent methyltransferase [Candidatus Halocynthiibacter alkanivorans]